MPFFRYISTLTLVLIFVFETSFVSVSALMNEGIAVNSLELLSLPVEEVQKNPDTKHIYITPSSIYPDIQSLLDAKNEYTQKKTIQKG